MQNNLYTSTLAKACVYATMVAASITVATAYASQGNDVKYRKTFDIQAKAAGLSDCHDISTWPGKDADIEQYRCVPTSKTLYGRWDVYTYRGNIMFIDYRTNVTDTYPGSWPSEYMLINTWPNASNYDCPTRVYFIDLTGKQPIAYRFGIKHACSTVADVGYYDPDGKPLPTVAEIKDGYRLPKLTVEQNRKYNGDVQWGKKTIILTMAGGFPFVYDRATHKFASLPTLTKTHGATLAFSTDINGNLLTDAQIDKIAPSVKPYADQVYPKPAASAQPAKP